MSRQILSGSNASPLIPGVAGQRIRVTAMFAVINNGSATWKFQSSGGPTELTSNLYFDSAAGIGPLVLPPNPQGWFETLVGEGLNQILVSGSAGLAGVIEYELVNE